MQGQRSGFTVLVNILASGTTPTAHGKGSAQTDAALRILCRP